MPKSTAWKPPPPPTELEELGDKILLTSRWLLASRQNTTVCLLRQHKRLPVALRQVQALHRPTLLPALASALPCSKRLRRVAVARSLVQVSPLQAQASSQDR